MLKTQDEKYLPVSKPESKVANSGVWYFGWMSENMLNKRPSQDMA